MTTAEDIEAAGWLPPAFAAVVADLERKGYKRFRRDSAPLLFVFRTVEAGRPGRVVGMDSTVIPNSLWRLATPDGVYDSNPGDDLENLGETLVPLRRQHNVAGGAPATFADVGPEGVVGCAFWSRVWSLPKDVLLDEESALRALKGERVIQENPRRVGASMLNARDITGRCYQILRPDKGAPAYAATNGFGGWEDLPDQSATKTGFALEQLVGALAEGVLPLP